MRLKCQVRSEQQENKWTDSRGVTEERVGRVHLLVVSEPPWCAPLEGFLGQHLEEISVATLRVKCEILVVHRVEPECPVIFLCDVGNVG